MFSVALFDHQSSWINTLYSEFEQNDLFCSVEEFDSIDNFWVWLSQNSVDIVVLDYILSEEAGVEMISKIRKISDKIFITFYSINKASWPINAFYAHGLNLYVDKSDPIPKLISRIKEEVIKQNLHIPPILKDYTLTKKEKEIIKYLSEGYSSKMIANALGNATSTINNHKNNLLVKLECKNSSQLIIKLFGLGYLKL